MSHDQESTRRDALRLGGTLVGAAVGATLLAQNAQAQGKTDGGAGGMRIAVVDIGVIFKNYLRKNDLEKQINAKKDRFEQQAKEQISLIDGLRKSLDLLKENTEMFRNKRKELKLAMKQAEVMRDSMDEELKLEVENLTLMILDEIEEKVKEFGGASKYDFIVKVDSKGWGDEKFQERIFRAQVSSVLYYDPKMDVTSTVLAALNDPAHIKKCQDRQLNGGGGGGQGNNPPSPAGPPK